MQYNNAVNISAALEVKKAPPKRPAETLLSNEDVFV